MTTEEFSNKFDAAVNSYANQIPFGTDTFPADFRFNEYEKSLFLTDAQEDIVKSLYSGKDNDYVSLEDSEEAKEALDELVTTYTTSTTVKESTDETDSYGNIGNFLINPKSTVVSNFYHTPEDLWYVIYAWGVFDYPKDSCIDGKHALVVPTIHDYIEKQLLNPFRGISKNRILQLDIKDDLVEVFSKYPLKSYNIRYIKAPSPIILTDLPDGLTIDGKSEKQTCQLNTILHDPILELAVKKAVNSKLVSKAAK